MTIQLMPGAGKTRLHLSMNQASYPRPVPSKVFLRPSPPMITSNSYSDTGWVLGCTSALQPIPVDQRQGLCHIDTSIPRHTEYIKVRAPNTMRKNVGFKRQKARGLEEGSQSNGSTTELPIVQRRKCNHYIKCFPMKPKVGGSPGYANGKGLELILKRT